MSVRRHFHIHYKSKHIGSAWTLAERYLLIAIYQIFIRKTIYQKHMLFFLIFIAGVQLFLTETAYTLPRFCVTSPTLKPGSALVILSQNAFIHLLILIGG